MQIIMVFMREIAFPKILSKAFIDDSKELKSLKLSDWSFCLHSCTKKCTGVFDIFPLHTIIVINSVFLCRSVDFISHLIATVGAFEP